MNAYIADQIAREHADRLMSDAVAARRARSANKARRAATTKTRTESTERSRPAASRPGTAAAAHFVARPFTAFRSWVLAGEL
jgi:hypothetical protein